MATSALPTELVLKFACPSCGNRLTMPVRKAGKTAPCPKCAHQVVAPPIDSSVDGYDQIAASVRSAASPHASQGTAAAMPPGGSPRGTSVTAPSPAPLPQSVQPPPQPQPASPPPAPVKEPLDELPEFLPIVSDPVVGRTARPGFSMPWRARWTWRLIFWGVVFFFGFLFDQTKFGPFAFLGCFWLFIAGRYVTTWVLPLCYGSFTCPGCHEVHNAVAFWDCGCGYHPHKAKHLFNKCPACGEGGGRTNCPRCGVTMLIW